MTLAHIVNIHLKDASIDPCAEETWYQTYQHPPAGLDEVVFLLMVCLVHVLGAGQTNGFHVGKQHHGENSIGMPNVDIPILFFYQSLRPLFLPQLATSGCR